MAVSLTEDSVRDRYDFGLSIVPNGDDTVIIHNTTGTATEQRFPAPALECPEGLTWGS